MAELEQDQHQHACAGCGRSIRWAASLCWGCREGFFSAFRPNVDPDTDVTRPAPARPGRPATLH